MSHDHGPQQPAHPDHEHDHHAAHAGHAGHPTEKRSAADDAGVLNRTAASATLHCLTGCAIGEIAGLVIGTALGLSTGWTVVLAVSLAFLFGYALSILPLLKAGLALGASLSIVVAADTLSIATMEIVDSTGTHSQPETHG